MNQHPFRAIVVGGSVGGLAGALELRRSAHAEVAVYERALVPFHVTQSSFYIYAAF